ncbi:MAG: biotin/lipoyl-containing protein [Bacteroidia bacterium]|nr:biotin/lipoyl-containing protein [Bacteroidia bacterium]
MAKSIDFCLVYRDMWQSSGKYLPRVDQLIRVAPAIIEMGCFRRVETNGGGFEQINLLFGENPNKCVREWTQPFNDVGIQTQMLERGLNGIRMSPVPEDVRKLMFKVKKLQGTDISRSFDGLNDTRNIKDSIRFAKEGGMVAQAALSITWSPIHTVDYYVNMAYELIEAGADEICIKDMAGIGRPTSIGKMVAGIKKKYPDTLVQYHGHSAPGFSVVSSLEAARAGADIIDVGMEPLSWGTGHADLLTVHEMLKDDGFTVPDINMDAYMHVRSLTQEFIDDFLGYYINPRNRYMNSLLIGPGLPGGMMGSLMADLEKNLSGLNKWLTKREKSTLTQDELLIRLFKEVEYIWPQMGYPPLVTPYSQYVKNVAMMNVLQMAKGRERWSMIADNVWDMLMGKSGKLPGKLGAELQELAADQGREFFTGEPKDLYPDTLDSFREEMKKEGWDFGEDNEELMELAMHPQQYRAYKSGKAKADFEVDLAERKAKKQTSSAPAVPENFQPKTLHLDVNGEKFTVSVAYDHKELASSNGNGHVKVDKPSSNGNGNYKEILAPLEGTFYLTKESSDTPIKVGDSINKGDVIGYIESMKVFNAISADQAGKVVEISANNGAGIEEDDVLIKVQ